MHTLLQQETQAILRLKGDYDAAIKDRDLWKAEADRWRKINQLQFTESLNDPIILALTNIEKLVKAINFIRENGLSWRIPRDILIEDGIAYKVISHFYDYHKGNHDALEKKLLTEHQVAAYLSSDAIEGSINQIMIEREESLKKQLRLTKFYAC